MMPSSLHSTMVVEVLVVNEEVLVVFTTSTDSGHAPLVPTDTEENLGLEKLVQLLWNLMQFRSSINKC